MYNDSGRLYVAVHIVAGQKDKVEICMAVAVLRSCIDKQAMLWDMQSMAAQPMGGAWSVDVKITVQT
jgi:hypothetical protein